MESWCIGKITGFGHGDEIYATPDAFHVDEFKSLILRGEGSAQIGSAEVLEMVPYPEQGMVRFKLSMRSSPPKTWDVTIDELEAMQKYIRDFDARHSEDMRRAMREVMQEAMSPELHLDPDAEHRTREALEL